MTGTRIHTRWESLLHLSPRELIALANHQMADDSDKLSPSPQRNVVNMLRHEFSDYDHVIRNARTDAPYNEVMDAIARDFPWLAEQCAADKQSHPNRLPLEAAARRGAHLDAQKRQRAGREIAKTLAVGDRVTVLWHGERTAVVLEVRRSRVRVGFDQPAHGGATEVDLPATKVRRAP